MSTPQEIRDDELEQRVFSALSESLTPAALPPDQHARLRHRILQAAAPAPEGTTTWRLRDAGWFSPAPHVEMKQLRLDEAAGTQEMLIRLAPGVRVPEHSHRKEEQMIILEGECHVGEHLLKQGDVHVAPPGSWHPAITTQRGVLLLLRCEHPLPVS